MTPNQYLKDLLESQALDKNQLDELEKHRIEVEGILTAQFGSIPTIRYSGSKAKGTMIAESYDLDIICYFPDSETKSLKDIYSEVWNVLGKYYKLEPKSSAIRIKKEDVYSEHDYHIDVVPGRYIKGDDGYAFIHVSNGEKDRLQTNIDVHVRNISKSDCREIIKLVKLWKVRNDLPSNLKTFVFELFTINALNDSRNKDDLAASFVKVMTALKDELISTRLEDPANSNNIVSDSITSANKSLIAQKAAETIETLNSSFGNEISRWKKVFDEASEPTIGPTIINNPPKPWSR